MRSPPPFLVCIHDASPAHDRETRMIIRELAPLVGRRLCLAVVPDWHGEWPLPAYRDYCRLIEEGAEELLLHGYFHQRRRGTGPLTWLVDGCDELNGLDRADTLRALERGQRAFTAVFGKPARGFVAPGWQRGHVRPTDGRAPGPDYVLGFFSLESRAGATIPLATWTWHCGRWGWSGHVGHGIGWLLQSLGRGVPALAIHPRDLDLGFWPKAHQLIRELLDAGYEPSTPAALLAATDVEAAV